MSLDTNKKRGMFTEPDSDAKRRCTANPEYQTAFQVFDRDGSGTIDICELNNALQAVKQSVESGTLHQPFPQPFHANTVLWLAARFAASGNGVIMFPQFAEMMQYLETLKRIFSQIDTDRTGDLSVSELSRALSLSGFNVTGLPGGGDALSLMVAEKLGRAYDADGNGVLTFDEFVQMRLEWDHYLDAWAATATPGMNGVAPQQLLGLLDTVKRSLEPVGAMAMHPAMLDLAGFSPSSCLSGLYYNSMFKAHRLFSPRTAELLIVKFGNGSTMINFEQFCIMMEFIKEQKKRFLIVDRDRTGSIDLNELGTAFGASGLPIPLSRLIELAVRYDQDNSGTLEFDEFLQMMAEMNV